MVVGWEARMLPLCYTAPTQTEIKRHDQFFMFGLEYKTQSRTSISSNIECVLFQLCGQLKIQLLRHNVKDLRVELLVCMSRTMINPQRTLLWMETSYVSQYPLLIDRLQVYWGVMDVYRLSDSSKGCNGAVMYLSQQSKYQTISSSLCSISTIISFSINFDTLVSLNRQIE